MSNAIPMCAKCGKSLADGGKIKVAAGKKYHETCAPNPSVPMKPVDVQQSAPQSPQPDEPSEQHAPPQEYREPHAPAPEARHSVFFAWQGQDGTVFNQTVRGATFTDFVNEWNAVFEWILSQGGAFVNAGRNSYAETPKPVQPIASVSSVTASAPSLPQSVSDQTTYFEADGVKYGVGVVKEMIVKTTTKGDLYLSVKVPPFLVHGVPAYKEVAVPHFGDLQQLSGKPIVISPEKQFVVFSFKEGDKVNKVVDFRASKNG